MDYKNYIKPVFSKATRTTDSILVQGIETEIVLGNGFLINDYLITAAHVIEDSHAYIKLDNKNIQLNRDNLVLYQSISQKEESYRNPNNADVAVFHINGIKSPLVLSDDNPIYGDTLCSYYYNDNEWNESIATVGGDNMDEWMIGNFFGCIVEPIHPTSGGSSGSPLIKGNIVYGILSAGNQEDPRICVFTLASFVNKMIS